MADSFVVRPHPNDFHNVAVFKNLVDKTMLNIDAARIRSAQIANKLFLARRSLKGVLFEDGEQFFGFRLESGSYKLLSIFAGLSSVNKRPLHGNSVSTAQLMS